MDRWLVVQLTVREGAEDLAGDVLLEAGASGYEVQDGNTFQQTGPGTIRLVSFFPISAGAPEQLQQRLVTQLGLRLEAGEDSLASTLYDLRIEAVDDPGWAEAWKQFFRPLPIGSRLLVRPPWEPLPAEGERVVLTLDPGLAFGTGHHPSTRMCLQVIEAAAGSGELSAVEVLDVGCGSGILAIAAVLLGTRRAQGIDHDPGAIEVAQENAGRNRVEDRVEFSTLPLQEVAGTFGLVVANILSGTLIQLAPELVARVTPGGRLVLAGLLSSELPTVEAVFTALGCHTPEPLHEPDERGEAWSALVLQTPTATGDRRTGG